MTRSELTKLIDELNQKHNDLNAMEITSPCEGLMYVRFDVDLEDEDDDL